MYIKNSIGPRTVPWGTPERTGWGRIATLRKQLSAIYLAENVGSSYVSVSCPSKCMSFLLLFTYLHFVRLLCPLPGRWHLFILDNAWNARVAAKYSHG